MTEQEATKITSVFIVIKDNVATEEVLKTHFASCGEIESIEMKSSTEAVIKFKEEEAAKKALAMSGSKLNDAEVSVCLVGPKKKGRVLVSNLPLNMTEEEIQKIFEKFGKIERIRLFEDSAGIHCAYLHFECSDSVEKALSMNLEMVSNKRIRVDYPNDPFRYHVEKAIIVYNMHERTTEEEIFSIFRQIGKLENVEKVSKTRAYVAFRFRSDIKQALRLQRVVRGFKWHIMQYYQEANPVRKRKNVNDGENEEVTSKIKRTENELYVANIPGEVTEEEIRTAFEQYGTINAIYITQHPSSLVDCCYIVYGSNEEAKKACVMNQQMWMDKRLRVCVVTDEFDVFGEGSAFSLMVKNFILGTTEEDLHDHFSKAGSLAYVKKIGNGCAVVAYDKEEDGKKALELNVMRPMFSTKESYVSIKYKGKQAYDIEQILHVEFTDPKRVEKGFYYSIPRKEIENFFQPCGRVVNYFTESRSGPEANHSLVMLENQAAAIKANGSLHGAFFKGGKMSVRMAKSKDRPDLPFNLRMILKKSFINDARQEFIQSDATILVSNLSHNETEETIKEYFKDCGEVLDMKCVGPLKSGWSCFLKFGSHEEAIKAKVKNCQSRNDKLVFVRLGNEKDVNEGNVGRVIAIKGYRKYTTSDEIYQHFIVNGEIEHVQFSKFSVRQFNCLVCFKKKEDAESAISNVEFKETKLIIHMATMKSENSADQAEGKTGPTEDEKRPTGDEETMNDE